MNSPINDILVFLILDLSFHREQSNLNMGGPPVQVRSHSKYMALNSDQSALGYQHQRMFPAQHENTTW